MFMIDLVLSLVFLVFSDVACAQVEAPNRIFQWQFSNNFLSTSLPSCVSFPITVKPFAPDGNSSGIGPYYMTAFAINGLPITSLLGENETSLSWNVTHPVGTKLMLGVVDSQGSSGGIPPKLYEVVTGQSTSCIQAPPPMDFTVSANITDPKSVTTCQPWGIRIKGGVPPYNLTLAALNSPVVTNLTMNAADDAFTFIDRADPGTVLIAAISDLTGRWAVGTPSVNTIGSPDVNCTGLVSSSGSASDLDKQQKAAEDAIAAKQRRTRSIIIGVCVTFGLLFLILGILATVFFSRKRKAVRDQLEAKENLDLNAKPFTVYDESTSHEPGQVLSINSWVSSPTSPRSPKSPYTTSSSALDSVPRDSQPTSTAGGTDLSRPSSSGSSRARPGFSPFPTTRRGAKALEANIPSIDSAVSPSDTGATEYIIQHRDAGQAVVRELPPPYADRSRRMAEESEQL
ncbi:hypothetical protein C8J56DRAFT_440084 [Mycena floridula]|nr:hypothetical protein C8J56DRAFT_440084 [Mycena floridula]